MCDGVYQCQDRSDEQGCAKHMDGCTHQCDNKSRCIPDNFLCDGERDCWDGSDEADCGMLSNRILSTHCINQLCLYRTPFVILAPAPFP